MKALIIYKSKTGFTQKYAEWIQEATKFDIISYENILEATLLTYELIIFGSRIHAGKVDGLKKIKEMLLDNERPQLVVFATGGTPIEAEEVIESIWKASFTAEELSTIPHFYMPAGLNYQKMGMGDKLIMKTLAKILKNTNNKNPVEAGCEQAIGQSYDIAAQEYISPLLKYLEIHH